MANKKSFFGLKLIYDAPATLTFAFICVILFAADTFLLKGALSKNYLCSPTTASGSAAFQASSPLSYLRLVLYSFGAASASTLVCNMIFVLLLGPSMEERYGTVVIAIMMTVCILFSGVLTACFSKTSLTGCSAVIFMMIFLNSFVSLSKKKIPVSFVVVFFLFIFREIFELGAVSVAEGIKIIINIAGGLCGSLFAFLTSPKAKSSRKADSEKADIPEKKSGLLKRASFFRKKADSKNDDRTYDAGSVSDADETIVSSMKFDD